MSSAPKPRRPCNDCPWRRDAKPEYWDPTHLESIYQTCQDDGMSVMACHKSNKLPAAERHKLVCQGWVRVIGFNSIGVRLAAMDGRVKAEEIRDRGGPKLYKSFEEMMKANRVKLPKRNKWVL